MSIQLTFRDFSSSEPIRAYVEKRAAKLLAHLERVVATRVTLAAPHRHHHHGHAYRVSIEVLLPGREIVISPRDGASGHADLYAAIDDAFEDAERQLREHGRMRRGEMKSLAAE